MGDESAAAKRSGGSIVRWASLGALSVGVAAVLMWAVGLVGLFMNMDTDENGLVATAALLVIVVLAALLTIPVRSGGSVFALVSAGIYAALWVYLRIGFHRTMPDAILLAITGLFFVAPLVTGLTAIAVGSRSLRRNRQAAASALVE